MNSVFSIVLGYLLGSLNPAALISKVKKEDLRTRGTGNLGASNTMLVFGKVPGFLVMTFDIAKGWCASKLAALLFPQVRLAGLAAGLGAVLGHVFPFYMKFKGGKGLAAFGGMVLAHDPGMFLVLLIFGCALVLMVNYSAVLPISAGILFPALVAVQTGEFWMFAIALAASVLIICKHAGNLVKGHKGEDIDIRAFLRENFFHVKENQG